MQTKLWLSFLTLIGLVLSTQTAIAQTYQPSNRIPVADSTLDTQVSGNGSTFNITGGLTKGQTLFHSFTDFSVPTNGAANFVNLTNPRDIISRVTGNSFSDINGLVNTNGANLFLINPNGIVFGTNAQLNVGRAFMASTANGINLVDGAGSAITFGTNANGDALLKIAPNVLFNVSSLTMGGGNGQISNFGTLQTKNSSQYIGLIGGNVTLDGSGGGGKIIAPGGRVDIGGLNSLGTITVDNNGLVFSSNGVGRSNVLVTNDAGITVRATGTLDTVNTFFNNATSLGSSINISASNIDILNSGAKSNTGLAAIDAGLELNSGVQTQAAGDINIDATGKVNVNNSDIKISLRPGSEGSIGGVKIQANTLDINNQSIVSSATSGQGNAGNVDIITTGDITITGNNNQSLLQGDQITNSNLFTNSNLSYIFTATNGQGNAGNVTIDAKGNISFANRGGIDSFVDQQGKGNGGNITVTAKNAVALTDANILSTVEAGGVGNGGTIDIKADSLSLKDGSQLLTITRGASGTQPAGQGDAGNINVKVTGAVDISGAKGIFTSGMFSYVNTGTKGNGGNITVDAGSLSLQDATVLQASTYGQGNAGNVTVTANNAVSLTGNTYIFSTVEPGGVGKGGNIDMKVGSLSLKDGAQLQTITRGATVTQPAGKGTAGNVNVKVTGDVDISGTKGIFPSGILSYVDLGTEGNGGRIIIDTGSFSLRDGAQILASTYGPGNAGAITVNATDFVSITGKNDNSTGLSVASQSPTGTAGDIILTSPKITLDGGQIDAISVSGKGGNIKIGGKPPAQSTDLLLLRHGGGIFTDAQGTPESGGDGGNITINSELIVAIPKENSDITATAIKGRGGNINIDSKGLFGIQSRPLRTDNSDITASSELNQQGTVNISTPGTDPGRDSTELPNTTTDASNQISQVCSADNRQNKLTVTGRGGLPPNANDPLTSDVVWQDARAASSQPAISSATTNPLKLAPPAVGWVFDGKGKVNLIVAATQGQPTGTRVVCPNVK